MQKSPRVLQYEVDYLVLERQRSADHRRQVETLPDIDAFLQTRSVRVALKRVQELIWTIRRIMRGGQARGSSPPTVLPTADATEPRILLDITATLEGKVYGGIKVVAKSLAAVSDAHETIIPVQMIDGALHGVLSDQVCVFEPGPRDIYVIMDHYWDALATYSTQLQAMKSRGCKIGLVIYDLIPIDYPAIMIDFELAFRMRRYLQAAINLADVILSISSSSLNDIRRLINDEGIQTSRPLDFFTLGAGKPARISSDNPPSFAHLFGDRPVFLSVGAMMPHKGHLIAMAAFDRLWREEFGGIYLILGPRMDDSVIEDTIRASEHYGRTLFRVDDATDADVAWAYRHATCLVQASIVEGFGLPVLEAQSYALPVIASDIPVFREVGRDALCYFETCNADALAQKIVKFAPGDWRGALNDLPNWEQSLASLKSALVRNLDMPS